MELTEKTVQDLLDWTYEKAISQLPGLDSAMDLAEDYRRQGGTPQEQADSLIRWQNTKAGSSGFITGLGGLATMPVAVPANLVSVIYIQVRMIAAIAHLGGHDVRDDRVKALALACLAGTAATELLKDVGVQVGKEVVKKLIGAMTGHTIRQINRMIGFRLLTKAGQTGVVNLTKAVPLVGGIVGGLINATSTNTIGNVARNIFIGQEQPSPVAA